MIEGLLKQITVIRKEHENNFLKEGKGFNIFSILKVERREVNTHSSFIAELLNPKGSHGQKDLFLKEFINEVKEKEAKIKKIDTTSANVKVEHSIGPISENKDSGGRIDILVESGNSTFLIENKIDAVEQPNQLLRYYNYKKENVGLFYLTLFGEESNSDFSKEKYRCISYEKTIISWLNSCKEKVKHLPILNETIEQYIKLIKKLTNQNQDKKLNDQMVKKVLKNEDNFASFVALSKIQNEIYQTIFSFNIYPTLEEIAKAKNLYLEIDKNKFLEKSGQWHSFYFTNKELKEKNLKIQFSFLQKTKLTDFIFGIARLDETKEISEGFNILKKSIFENFKEVFSTAHTSSWICYKIYDEYRDWEDLDTLKKIKFEGSEAPDFNFGNFRRNMEEKIKLLIQCCDLP